MTRLVESMIDAAVGDLAARLDGEVGAPGTWFDGFWDWVVDHRERLQRGPAWEIQGVRSAMRWALVVLARESDARALEVSIFVDAKDRSPGARAPWPVSSLTIPGGSATQAARDPFARAHDPALAASLRQSGFVPHVGYWGVRCDWSVDRVDPAHAELVDAMLTGLPDSVAAAVALGASLATRDKPE